MMKVSVYALFFFLVLACQKNEPSQEDQIGELIFVENLAVDGCSLHASQNLGDEWQTYSLTEKSKKIVLEKFSKNLNSGTLYVKQAARFRLTGKTTEIVCGWNTKQEYQEIEIRELL